MLTESKDGVVQKTYTYDKFDRLATYTAGDTTAQYTYNGDNLRQSKTVNNVTTQHLYNGANIVADICGDNTQLYIRGNSLHFNKALGSTDKQTYILSPKGDVSKIINADGTYQHFEYIPYGEISEGELQANNPFGYCGEYTDAESGLIYLRNRYYNPEFGMFITEDPIKDGLNWYAYCNGNPVNFVDPWGLYDLEVDKNGNVYAIIEQGDTLSSISKAEVNDENAWLKIGYLGDPNNIQIGEKININGIYNNEYPKNNVVAKYIKPFGTIRGIYYETNLYNPFQLDDLNNYSIINGALVITSPEDVEIAKKIEDDYISKMFLLVAGTKLDIKQVSSVVKSLKMTPNQAAMFKQEIEYLKKSVGKMNNMNFSYKELLEIGKEIVEMFK